MLVYLREYLWLAKHCKQDLHAYAIECVDVEKAKLLKEKKLILYHLCEKSMCRTYCCVVWMKETIAFI